MVHVYKHLPEIMVSFMLAGRTVSLFTTPAKAHQSIVRCGVCNSSLSTGPSRAVHGLIAAKGWNMMLINNAPLRVTKSSARVVFERSVICRSSIGSALSPHRAHTWEGIDGATVSESRLTTKSWLDATESRSSVPLAGGFVVEKGDHQGISLRASASSSKSNRTSSPGRRGDRTPGSIGRTYEPRVAGGRGPAVTGTGGRGTGQTATIRVGGGRRGPGSARGVHNDAGARVERLREIPEDRLQMSFTRSSGSGGQNVNKVNTKVEIRFIVEEAEWLPHDVRLRLARHQSSRVNSRGELVITSQEFRTQKQNRHAAMQKLREMINEAWEPAKERKMRTGISKAGKEMRLAEKHRRAKIKSGRSKLSSKDYDD